MGKCSCRWARGLEIVEVFNLEWQFVEQINLASEPTWNRFKKGQDYRLVGTTKPHEAHANHIFVINDRVWVTRGQKQDAVNLYDFEEKISLYLEASHENIILCHDGIVRENMVYFTSVDGHLIVVSDKNGNSIEKINLNQAKKEGTWKTGWIRGLEIIENSAFVGTSMLRSSKFKEYGKWLLSRGQHRTPSCIMELDIRHKKIVDYYVLENNNGSSIFTILKHP